MKNNSKKQKKLTQTDYQKMWGEDGPYSQVRLCEETRILDDGVSRVFLVVEAEINPFTFEYIQKNWKQFLDDEAVLQLLNHAENRDKFGYVVSAGEIELQDEKSRQFARKQADMAIQTLIRMHKYVIDAFDINKRSEFGVITDKKKLIWNEKTDEVEMIDQRLWDSETLIGSPVGAKNNKMRFFIILAFAKNFDFKNKSTTILAKTLKVISARLKIEFEDMRVFHDYVLIKSLVPFDITPAQFIESILDECLVSKKPIFQKDYLVTNVKKPTQKEIMSFIAQLPLEKDIRMKFK